MAEDETQSQDPADPAVAAKAAEESEKEKESELEEERRVHMEKRFSDDRRPDGLRNPTQEEVDESLAPMKDRAPGTVTPDDAVTASPAEKLTERDQQGS